MVLLIFWMSTSKDIKKMLWSQEIRKKKSKNQTRFYSKYGFNFLCLRYNSVSCEIVPLRIMSVSMSTLIFMFMFMFMLHRCLYCICKYTETISPSLQGKLTMVFNGDRTGSLVQISELIYEWFLVTATCRLSF